MISPPIDRPHVVSLRLAVDNHAPRPVPAFGAMKASSRREPIRAVLVDDDEDLRGAVRQLLEDEGFDIVGEAADGASGVELVRTNACDLVLMDLRMPGLDGIEATRRMRAHDPDIRVVLLSAYDDPGFKQQAAAAGAVAYVTKGTRGSRLLEILQDAVNGPHGRTDP